MTRTTDCVAESPDQLMYITGDTLILLREEEEVVIAACEGVVGWIKKGDVDFGPSVSTSSSTGAGGGDEDGKTQPELKVPNTIISSPTPPSKTIELPPIPPASTEDEGEGGLEVDHPAPDSRRASGPFDLGTPNHSPRLDQQDEFFERDAPPVPPAQKRFSEVEGEGNRASVLSTASSDALGGIGGFMMGSSGDGESFISRDGDGDEDGDTREDLKGESIILHRMVYDRKS